MFGSYTPGDIYNTMLAIEVKLVLDYTDVTFRDMLNADTANYLSLVIQGAATIGASSNPKLNLVLNKAMVTDWQRSGGMSDVVTQEVTLKGFYNATDTAQSSCVPYQPHCSLLSLCVSHSTTSK